VVRLRADAEPEAWARAALDQAATRLPGGAAEALAIVAGTTFDGERTLPILADLYHS
jgi:hypothetical protein